ncbi:unnamed protein product [Somion occarium]|uniref:Uncharacterized protein n=1 Tax=Somion occarium TaxID=3059160 RepID=A0ABP1E865_9APHY
MAPHDLVGPPSTTKSSFLSKILGKLSWSHLKSISETIKRNFGTFNVILCNSETQVRPTSTNGAVEQGQASLDVDSSISSTLVGHDTPPLRIFCAVRNLAVVGKDEADLRKDAAILEDAMAATNALEALLTGWDDDGEDIDPEGSSIETQELVTPEGSPLLGDNVQIVLEECETEDICDVNFGEIIYGPHSPAWFTAANVDHLEVPLPSYNAPRFQSELIGTNSSRASGQKFNLVTPPLKIVKVDSGGSSLQLVRNLPLGASLAIIHG